jgi:hypothetical protein
VVTLKTERHHHNGSAHAAFNACIEGMFTVCHTEEAELLPPQLLPRRPVYDTILIWFLILFPVLSCGVVLVFWFWREIVFCVT